MAGRSQADSSGGPTTGDPGVHEETDGGRGGAGPSPRRGESHGRATGVTDREREMGREGQDLSASKVRGRIRGFHCREDRIVFIKTRHCQYISLNNLWGFFSSADLAM